MKDPNGKDLLSMLIRLLGEQEGVKIKCELELVHRHIDKTTRIIHKEINT